ncbi:MAG: formylglycine-generating enzyme family protein, partial [Planctomycetota bacterium]
MGADVRNFKVIVSELDAHRDKLQRQLWSDFRKVGDEDKRFRAGLALARYAPDEDQWTDDDAKFLVDSLLSQIPEDQPLYRDFLAEVNVRLYPELKRAFLDPRGKERQTVGAARAFAEFAADDLTRIADVAVQSSPEQWQVLAPVFDRASPADVGSVLRPLASQQPVDSLSPIQRVTLGKRRAGAAIALLRNGNREDMFDALRVTDDPESLTQFVHRCHERGVMPKELLECLEVADKSRQSKQGDERQIEDRVLFGILLALGEFSLQEIPDAERLIDLLADWYAGDPSSTIHGATGWLLRRWSQNEVARKVDQTPVPFSPDRQWYTLEFKSTIKKVPGRIGEEVKTYMTFIVIPAGTYAIGSPENEPGREEIETRHEVTIPRPFALLDREVSWVDATVYNAYQAIGMRNAVQQQSGFLMSLNDPWVVPNWYDAVMFCRWLTEQVGLGEAEQVYANPARLDPAKYPRDTDRASGGFPIEWPADLDARGFHLLTEPQWEVACRAGTLGSWSFGSDSKMLDRYGWFMGNSARRTHPGRIQRPNLRGIFDMHGNALEWCHDWFAAYPGGPNVREGQRARVYRGGGWSVPAETCRSAFRHSDPPALRINS